VRDAAGPPIPKLRRIEVPGIVPRVSDVQLTAVRVRSLCAARRAVFTLRCVGKLPVRSAAARLALAPASSRDVQGQRRVTTSADVASTTRMTRDQYVITPTTSVL